VTGLVTAFGSGAMTNSIADITHDARAYLIIGSNTTEQHPVIGIGIRQAVANGAKLVVADPRRIDLTRIATVHLRHRPGTDVALLNGLAHVILREGWHDADFIATRTENFEAWREVIEKYTPERVSEITGVPVDALVEAARIYATNKPAKTTCRARATWAACPTSTPATSGSPMTAHGPNSRLRGACPCLTMLV